MSKCLMALEALLYNLPHSKHFARPSASLTHFLDLTQSTTSSSSKSESDLIEEFSGSLDADDDSASVSSSPVEELESMHMREGLKM